MMISSDDMLFTFGVETVPTGSWLHNIWPSCKCLTSNGAAVKGTPPSLVPPTLHVARPTCQCPAHRLSHARPLDESRQQMDGILRTEEWMDRQKYMRTFVIPCILDLTSAWWWMQFMFMAFEVWEFAYPCIAKHMSDQCTACSIASFYGMYIRLVDESVSLRFWLNFMLVRSIKSGYPTRCTHQNWPTREQGQLWVFLQLILE